MGCLPVARAHISNGRLRDSHPGPLGSPRLRRGALPRRPRHPHRSTRAGHAPPGHLEHVLLAGSGRGVTRHSPASHQLLHEEQGPLRVLRGPAHPRSGQQPVPRRRRGPEHGPPRRTRPGQPVRRRGHLRAEPAPRLHGAAARRTAQPGPGRGRLRRLARYLPRRPTNGHATRLPNAPIRPRVRLPRGGHLVSALH